QRAALRPVPAAGRRQVLLPGRADQQRQAPRSPEHLPLLRGRRPRRPGGPAPGARLVTALPPALRRTTDVPPAPHPGRRTMSHRCRLGLLALLLALLAGLAPLAGAADDKDEGFIPLFNGKDLTGFYTYLRGLGKNNDPDKVFTVQDGAIRVSGQTFGCF